MKSIKISDMLKALLKDGYTVNFNEDIVIIEDNSLNEVDAQLYTHGFDRIIEEANEEYVKIKVIKND